MTDDTRWKRYWRYLNRRFEGEVQEEMDYHLEQRAKDLEAEGLSADEARREALRRFGDRTRVQADLERIERGRGRRITLGFLTEELWQDVRYGIRGLFKRPGFTFATATSLALGIATITLVVSAVDSLLLRPLPVEHAKELVVIGASTRATGQLAGALVSLPTGRDVGERHDLFQDVAAVQNTVMAVRRPDADQGQRRMLLVATGNYFSVLGLSAFRGRLFTPEDDRQREQVIVLNHSVWQSAFGADPSVIGTTIYLNTVPFVIIGVTPPGFYGTEHFFEAYGFVPTGALGAIDPSQRGAEQQRLIIGFKLMARRQPGLSMNAIQAGLDVLSRQLTSTYPELEGSYRLIGVPESRARPTLEAGVGTLSGAVVFSALAALVLLTAAVNATNLILVRSSARRSELAVRQALGASRRRVVRQLVTETMLLAALGLAGGWLLARLAVDAISSVPITAIDLPLRLGIAVDWRIFGVAVLITVVTGLVASAAPAIATSRFDLQRELREGKPGLSRSGQRMRSTLVVLQVSASMVVVVIVALLGESVRHAAAIDLGFKTDHVLTFGLDPSLAQYDDARARRAYEQIERRFQEHPGIIATAWANSVSLSAGSAIGGLAEVKADGTTETTKRGTVGVVTSAVSPSWFELVRMPILEGRAFLPTDDSVHPAVAIVNQRAADLLWPGQPAVGKVIRLAGQESPIEVVGVVKTSRYLLIGESPRPYLYRPFAQQSSRYAFLYARTEQDPSLIIPEVPRLLSAVDRDLVAFGVSGLEESIQNSMNGLLLLRIAAGMAAALGIIAVILTCVGLYGVVAYSVAQRSREIGLRIALGADPWTVIRSVVGGAGLLAAIGIMVGTALALIVTRPLAGLVVGVNVRNPIIFAAVASGLTLLAFLSAYIPARRASRIDPVRALRAEA